MQGLVWRENATLLTLSTVMLEIDFCWRDGPLTRKLAKQIVANIQSFGKNTRNTEFPKHFSACENPMFLPKPVCPSLPSSDAREDGTLFLLKDPRLCANNIVLTELSECATVGKKGTTRFVSLGFAVNWREL